MDEENLKSNVSKRFTEQFKSGPLRRISGATNNIKDITKDDADTLLRKIDEKFGVSQ